MLRRKACSVQGTEPSSVGFRVPMVCEDCGSAQKYLPETNPGKEESVVCEDAATLRPTSAAKVFKQNGREGGHFPVAEEKSRFEQEKCASYGCENRSVRTEACDATSGVLDLQTSWEKGHEKDMGKNAAQCASGQQPAKYEKKLKVALRAVQLACMLTQRIQDRLLRHEESATAKNDRSRVTIADPCMQVSGLALM